jgi:hypothetical protein
MVNRRAFLRILALGVVGHELDIDRLLWVPGSKTIFLPTETHKSLTTSQIIALEMERVLPKIATLFERDDTFYRLINKKDIEQVSSRPMRVPLQFGIDWGKDES